MNILVNALPLTGLLTGMPRYVRCLYRQMECLPDVSISYFDGLANHSKMPDQAEPGLWARRTEQFWRLPDPLIVGLNVIHWYRYEQRLRNACLKKPFHVYHETTFFPAALKDVPVVYTLHDLSLIKFRDKHPRERIWFFDLFFKRRLPYASHILTVSEFMRNEILEELKLPPHTVTAVLEAPDPVFAQRTKSEISRTLEANHWPKEYILYVGTLEPRKNLPLLIRSLSLVKEKIPLILVGWQGWGDQKWCREIEALHLKKRVYVAGYVDEATLACLYSGASAFVYPSLYEGFGLPVLEAMACGCPVICSNVSSLPEVAGDAAVLINPQDPEDLAHALDRVLTDSHLRQSLIARGLDRVTQFSWQKTAAQTLNVFTKVAHHV